MKFVNNRLSRDMELSRALSECTDLSDAVNLQQEWAQQAAREYLEEAKNLTETASKIANECWQPVYEQASKALTDVPKSEI